MRSLRAILAILALGGVAAAEPTVTLRLATVAPEGTAWARELKAFARDVATQTNEGLQVKWYLGGIAGDDVIASERIRKDQLDGLGSGGMLCERISPTMRAMHMLTETREEAFYLSNRLHKQIEEEFKKNGYVYLGAAGLGPDVLFTREPVRTMDDLKKFRLWVWDLDDVATVLYPALGVHTVPGPVNEGYKAYEEQRIDGFIALPAAALAFQWSAQTRYVSDLRMGFVTGCVVVAQRAYDQIPVDVRDAFRAAGAKLQARMEDLGRQQDEALLHGGMFIKQGLRQLPVPGELKQTYQKAARVARTDLGKKLVAGPQLPQVEQLLEEFRHQAK